MGVENSLPARQIRILCRLSRENAGTIDESMQAAALLVHCLHGGQNAVLGGDINSNCLVASVRWPSGLEFFGNSPGFF